MAFLFNPASLSGDEAAIEEINQGQKWASGENQKGYAATAKGSRLYIAQASTASPDTTAAPTGKVVRTSAVTQATINAAESSTGSDGGDVLAAFMGVHVGTAASETQTVGLAGFAKNGSNSEENPDACGLYGVGRITAGTSIQAGAFGLFAVGRRDVATATATGAEIQSQNYTATPGSYKSNGSSDTKGIWLNANGEADSGVGFQIQNAFGRQFKVGIGFGNQLTGGLTGGVAESSIRDDSTSEIAYDVRGTHSKAALRVSKESGTVIVGTEALTGESPPQLLEVHAGGVAKTPLVKLTAGANANITLAFNNSTSNFLIGNAGATNGLMTGTAVGDGVVAAAAGKTVHLGASAKTSQFRVAEAGIGFYGTAPQTKQEVTGSRATGAALTSLLEKLATIGLITNGSTA
jgi:hypothetical protein